MSDYIEYITREELMQTLATIVAQEITAAIANEGSASLAVPGGTTPAPFFKHLRSKDLDWGKVTILLTDERLVDESSDRSNTKLIRENLLQEKAAAARYVNITIDGIADVQPLDVCVLGMGTDMHTASIFPNAEGLSEALSPNAPDCVEVQPTGDLENRRTISGRMITDAKSVHILIAGLEKKNAYQKAIKSGPIEEAPIRLALHRDLMTVTHYAD